MGDSSGAMVEAAVFDFDGTITRRDTYLPFLASTLGSFRRSIPRVAGLALPVGAWLVGKHDTSGLKSAFLKAFLGGIGREQLTVPVERFNAGTIANWVRPAAVERIEEHRRLGHRLVLASAGLDLYVEPCAKWLGFDDVLATRCAWDSEGRLTGLLAGPNLKGRHKLNAVVGLLGGEIERRPVAAYSDHMSDLPLLRWAKRGVLVSSNRWTRRIALSENLAVEDWR